MNFIKKFLQLKKINIFIIMGLLATLSCSGPQVITSGAGAAIAAAEDEKTLGDVFDDTSISIGIKDRVFMYEAILVTKIDVDVEKGKVLLTGILNDQSQRVEVVRLAWKQPGVKEVINEIEIEDSFNIKNYAEDKIIQVQLVGKVLSDKDIKKLKYNFEVQNKVIFILGVTSDEAELERVFDHARSIKGVQDIISYVDIISTDSSDS
ncbi:MAG: BON domain-containing protein [Alphaproteobacteria bacterium]|jgi:osmotically-inducible protein OsmY|nr:BON domain-containing protein [Alphaproteobacteria bacterium]